MNSKVLKRYIDRAVKREVKRFIRDGFVKDIILMFNKSNRALNEASNYAQSDSALKFLKKQREYLNVAKNSFMAKNEEPFSIPLNLLKKIDQNLKYSPMPLGPKSDKARKMIFGTMKLLERAGGEYSSNYDELFKKL